MTDEQQYQGDGGAQLQSKYFLLCSAIQIGRAVVRMPELVTAWWIARRARPRGRMVVENSMMAAVMGSF
ncbi:hypothetical protein [Streptomyces sp. NPDC041003]|uniref:hypothetical protein n=1 Tax=Streptomyces sp. NPDC041003 TaxID=3155730 RepID=UPI0033D11C9D